MKTHLYVGPSSKKHDYRQAIHQKNCLLFEKSDNFFQSKTTDRLDPLPVCFRSLFKEPPPRRTYFLNASMCQLSNIIITDTHVFCQ